MHQKFDGEGFIEFQTEQSAKKVFTDKSNSEYISLARRKCRAYFITPHGNWFSAEEETEIESGITDVGEYRIQVSKTIFTYSDLRIEKEATVKALIGKNDLELYRQYFGEVDEAWVLQK